MTAERLTIHASPALRDARMVLGFSGWMDGGDVSTGSVAALAEKLGAELLAEIDPQDFYLYSFPGSMETAAQFRPHVRIEDGLLKEFCPPTNRFYHAADHRLILFAGKEPQLHWDDFADCIFAVARQFDVRRIYFIGSVAGLVPHTRRPRMFGSVSAESLRPMLDELGIRPSNYTGPGSLITHLTRRAPEEGLSLMSLVAEIPAYVDGRNHRCMEFAIRQLAAILEIPVDLDDLRQLGDLLEERLNEAVKEHEDLAERIRGLESDYDNEVFDTQMGDLKDWLEQRGVQLD